MVEPTTLQIASVGCPFAFALPHGGQCVGRLAALRDGEDHCHVGHGRISVTQLAGVLDLGRDPREFFQQVFADKPRVPARAAGREHDPVHPPQILRIEVQAAELGRGLILIEAAPHSVFDGLRLLEDLLEHVMLEAAAVRVAEIFFEEINRRRMRPRVAMRQLHPLRLERDDLVIGEIGDLLRKTDERTGIAGEKILLAPDSNHERTAESRTKEDVRQIAEENRQPVCPFQHGHRMFDHSQADPLVERTCLLPHVFVELMGHQVGNRLGIGPRAKDVAQLLQLIAEGGVVLDHAVVHEDDFAVAANMRMRIDVRRRAVRGPPRMADADAPRQRSGFQRGGQGLYAPRLFPHADAPRVGNGDPGTVVAAIFEPVQTFDQDFLGRSIADISHDPAHGLCTPSLQPR